MMSSRLVAFVLAASLGAGTALAQTPQTGAAPVTRPAAPAATTTAPAAQPAAKTPLIDINHASKAELDVLPGVGPARAEAIIKGRPYKGKDELLRKKVLPESVYEGIKDRIIARQS